MLCVQGIRIGFRSPGVDPWSHHFPVLQPTELLVMNLWEQILEEVGYLIDVLQELNL